MSFSYELKKELINIIPKSESSFLSELSAIIRTCAEIKLKQGKFLIVINSEYSELYQKINTILETLYGFSVELEISEDESVFHGFRYEIKIDSAHSIQVLEDCGIVYYDDEHNIQFEAGIDKYIVMDEEDKKSYIRGAFIGCGTSSIVLTVKDKLNTKKNAGYHLEFVFTSEKYANDFSYLLADFDILGKKVERKHSYVVYLKEAEFISDLLALMGANKMVLKLNNEVVFRSLRNQVNRQNNCETGNISKVVNASIKQVLAIQTISETVGLETLPQILQEVAMLRLANQEESLDELVKLSATPITKSGLNHRFRKIIQIANTLKK